VQTTIALIQMGVPIARCELMDAHAVRAVNARDHLGLKESPLLLMEFHGSPAGVAEQTAVVQELAREHGGEDFQWATTPEERTRLWAARHHAFFSTLQMRPGSRAITTDACVPISRLAENVVQALDEAAATGLPHAAVGHVGDGNFHMIYLIDPARPRSARWWNSSTSGWCAGPSPAAAPAPASTASACTSRAFCWRRPAGRGGDDARPQGRAGSAPDPEPGQDLPGLRAAGGLSNRG
jgi:FAD/FMN-containing dehydrogenase